MSYYPGYTSVIQRTVLISCAALLGLTLSLTTKAAPDDGRLRAGFNALEGMCFACHSPEPKPDQRIAPPISAIKKHYIERYADFQDFSSAFTGFVAHPTAERAILRGAIKRFGLMPQLSIDDASVADIAYYLYYTALEDPAWFAEHYEAEHGKPAKKPKRQYR
jgi:hypothetical protein